MSLAERMRRLRPTLTQQIIGGLLLGAYFGFAAGKDVGLVGDVGRLIIQMIKVAATPLLLLTILNAVLTTEMSPRAGARMMGLATINATIALCLGLLLSNVFKPGRHLSALAMPVSPTVSAARPIEPLKVLEGFVPQSLVQPFADNAVLPLVVMALLLGFALRRLKDRGEDIGVVEKVLRVFQGATELILGWIIHLVPFAVFSVVAKAVGEHGFAPLRGLAAYVAVGMVGLALHPLLTYQLWLSLYARMPLRRFWEAAREPITYAAGANSSLATLPLTLKALDRLKVSKASSALGACVGTNLNNDGIILYEAMAVLFVAQAHGLDLTLGQQVVAAVSCLIAAMGIAGVPEAGFVSLSLVLATVGLPLEILPLLLTVDWILARGRSVVNVLSDMMVSILLDAVEGRRYGAFERSGRATAADV